MPTKVVVPTAEGEREFTIGKPGSRVYVNLLKFVSRLMTRGYEEAVRKMASIVAAGGTVDDTMLLMYAIDQLQVDDLERLAGLLLHFEDLEQGREFVAQAGFDLVWVTEAAAANAEEVDIEQIAKNLQRAAQALGRRLPKPKGKRGAGS
jgi:hypothetical protein